MILIFSYFIYMTLAAIGITSGYHRYFAHKEFKASVWQEVVMLYCGLLCGGRSVIGWVGVHRMHHAYADTEHDPHSPKYQPRWRVLFSTWKVDTIQRKYIIDMMRNKRVMFFHKYGTYIFLAHQIIFFLLFGIDSLIVHSIVFALAYIGFGILNLWGHNVDGPVNRVWINLIAPFEGNHSDHHTTDRNRT